MPYTSEYESMPHGTKVTVYVVDSEEYDEKGHLESIQDYETLDEYDVIFNELEMPYFYDVMPDGRYRLGYDIYVNAVVIVGKVGEIEQLPLDRVYFIGDER